MAVKCYISEEKQVKVIRIIPKDGVGPGIKAAIDRITSLEGGLSAASGETVFENYVLGAKSPYLVDSMYRSDVYYNAGDRSTVIWLGEETEKRVRHKAPLHKIWESDYFTTVPYRCGVELVTRYPVTLAVLQYLTGNKKGDYELELFKLFLSQNSGDTNGLELERSFGFLENMISVDAGKEYLMYMIREMYPDLYHFVIDVMPLVDVENVELFDDNIFRVSHGKAQNNARGLKLVRQLHKIANNSNN